MIRDKILALKSMQPFTVKNDDVVDIVDLDTDDEETSLMKRSMIILMKKQLTLMKK